MLIVLPLFFISLLADSKREDKKIFLMVFCVLLMFLVFVEPYTMKKTATIEQIETINTVNPNYLLVNNKFLVQRHNLNNEVFYTDGMKVIVEYKSEATAYTRIFCNLLTTDKTEYKIFVPKGEINQ